MQSPGPSNRSLAVLEPLEPRLLLAASVTDFSASVNWIYYQDGATRQVAYPFSPGSMLPNGAVNIPAAAGYSSAAGESTASFALEPVGGSQSQSLVSGQYTLAVLQPLTALAFIPTGNITVDGSAADWVGISPYASSAASGVGPAGSDIQFIKLAYSADKSQLYFLIQLAANADPTVRYSVNLDKDLNGDDGDSGDYGIGISNTGSVWAPDAQTWDSSGGYLPATVATNLAVSGPLIEGSLATADVGLPGPVNVIAESSGDSGATAGQPFDRVSTGYRSGRGQVFLNGQGLSATPPDSWTWAASFSHFANYSNPGMYHGLGLQADQWTSNALTPEVDAGWFTGTYKGVNYTNVLAFDAGVYGGGPSTNYNWSWDPDTGGGLFLTGLDPATAKVDLKVVVSASGQTADYYYRVNSANTDQTGSDWVLLVSHTLPPSVGAMTAMSDSHPYIQMETSLAPAAANADFGANVSWLYYQDTANRLINDDFSSDTIDTQGLVAIGPAGMPSRGAGETGTTFQWEPGTAPQSQSLGPGGLALSLPQPAPTLTLIPTAAVTVDGSTADWSSVPIYVDDANGETLPWMPAGSDVDYLKLAYSPDKSRLNILFKLNANADPNVWYRLFLNRRLDNSDDDAPGNYQVDLEYNSGLGAWQVVSQGWNADGSWYPLTDGGVVAAAGQYLEASISASAFGLPTPMDVSGETLGNGTPNYDTYDRFTTGYRESWANVSLGSIGPVDPAPADWTLAVRVSGYANCSQSGLAYDTELETDSGQGVVLPWMDATWFTGTYQGVAYNHVLAFDAGVQQWGASPYDWQWGGGNGPGLFLSGQDPATTTLDLKMVVSGGGQTVDFYYRLNSASPDASGTDWVLLTSYTLPVGLGSMDGFAAAFPDLRLSAQLMPVTVSPAALSGPWAIATFNGHGTVIFDGAGGITGGSFTNNDGTIDTITGGSYEIYPDGTVKAEIDTDNPSGGVNPIVGALNASGDLVIGTNADRTDGSDDNEMVMVKHTTTFSNADLAGVWGFSSYYATGTMVLDGSGHILGGSWVDENGVKHTAAAGGTYSVAADGTVNVTLPPGSSTNPFLVGTLNDSKDVLALNDVPPVSPPGDPTMTVLTRKAGAFSTADVSGPWAFISEGSNGTMVFDGRGHITGGSYTSGNGQQFHFLGGTYSIASDGKVTGAVTTDEPGSPKHNFVGLLSPTRDFMAITDAKRRPGTNDDDGMVLLANSGSPADLAASVGPFALPGSAIPGDSTKLPVTITNLGQVASAGSVTIDLYGSTDTPLGSGLDVSVGSMTVPIHLGGGMSTTVVFNVTLPLNMPANSYNFVAVVTAAPGTGDADGTNNQAASGSAFNVVWEFGQVGLRKNLTLRLLDGDGTLVTFPLAGPGTGQVTDSGGQWSLIFSGTTMASACDITTRHNAAGTDDGELDLYGINASLPIGSLTSRVTDLYGSAYTFLGGVGQFIMDDVYGPATLILGPAPVGKGPKAASIRFDDVEGLSIASAMPLASLKATQWLQGAGVIAPVTGLITAPWIGSLTITGRRAIPSMPWRAIVPGDFFATVNLFGADSHGVSLGTFAVNGAVLSSDIRTFGNVGYATVGAMQDSLLFAGVNGPLTALPTAAGDFVPGRVIGTFRVRGLPGYSTDAFKNSQIAAWLLGDVMLSDVDHLNSGVPFGLAAHVGVNRLRLFVGDKCVLLKTNLKSSLTWPPPDDFEVTIV